MEEKENKLINSFVCNAVDGDDDKLEINISGAKEKKPKKLCKFLFQVQVSPWSSRQIKS